MRQRVIRKWCLITFLLIGALLISPHILANQSLFSISEGFLQSFEEKQEAGDYLDGEPIQLENNFPWINNPSVFDQEFYYIATPSSGAGLGNKIYPLEATTWKEPQKGNVLGQYSLLPLQYMDVILYKKHGEAEDVFRMTELPDNLQEILPSGEYTIEAQSHVWDGFSVFYGYDTLEDFNSVAHNVPNAQSNFISQNAGLKLNLLPGMILNADYKKRLTGTNATTDHKSFNLAFRPGHYASFTAGYGVISTNPEGIETRVFSTTLPSPVTIPGQDPNDNTVIKQWGMELHPSDYSKLSADYIATDTPGTDPIFSKTVFGLSLGDQSKELNATYQLESQENQKITTSAGVEVGFVDLARLRAVYSKIEEMQEERSKKSTLDLGFNFNFADYSSLDIKYKWALPEAMEPDKEQVAEATLEIKF